MLRSMYPFGRAAGVLAIFRDEWPNTRGVHRGATHVLDRLKVSSPEAAQQRKGLQQLAIDLSGSLVQDTGCRLAYPDQRTKHHWPGWPSCHTVDRLPG